MEVKRQARVQERRQGLQAAEFSLVGVQLPGREAGERAGRPRGNNLHSWASLNENLAA